ncbi:MAG: SPASM domain-containing protein, partial [Gammaproteobacteria bacterium]|nr:SPASM domain-containing protein [Gammaproteobacteria bacterium]
ETSSRCNNKCKDCAASMGLREQGDMSTCTFNKCIGKLMREEFEEAGLFLLGNPLLNKNIYKMVAMVVSAAMRPFITINIDDLCPDVVIRLCDAGIKSVKISVSKCKLFKPSAIWSAGYCVARGVDFSASMIIKHKTTVFNFYKHHYRENLIDLYPLPLHNCAGVIDNGGKGCPGTWDNPAPLTPCYPLFRGFYVDWKGRNTLCPICHDEKFLNGSLLEHSALELWHSEFAQDLRNQHLTGNITHPSCRKCLGL